MTQIDIKAVARAMADHEYPTHFSSMKTYYITTYLFTQGILVGRGLPSSYGGVHLETLGGDKVQLYILKGHWHTTVEEAKRRAEEMRQKKIKAMEKQIAKLKAMEFTINPTKK